jgi:hypothetical protein
LSFEIKTKKKQSLERVDNKIGKFIDYVPGKNKKPVFIVALV